MFVSYCKLKSRGRQDYWASGAISEDSAHFDTTSIVPLGFNLFSVLYGMVINSLVLDALPQIGPRPQ